MTAYETSWYARNSRPWSAQILWKMSRCSDALGSRSLTSHREPEACRHSVANGSYRFSSAKSRRSPIGPESAPRFARATVLSDFGTLSQREGIIDVHPKVADRVLYLAVAQ